MVEDDVKQLIKDLLKEADDLETEAKSISLEALRNGGWSVINSAKVEVQTLLTGCDVKRQAASKLSVLFKNKRSVESNKIQPENMDHIEI